jgi:hypothetical protein
MSPESRSSPPPVLNALPGRRKTFRRILFWFLGLGLAGLALMISLLVCKDTIIRLLTQRKIRQETGMNVEIGEMRLGLASSSLLIRNFRIYNTPEFGGGVFLNIPEIFVQMDPEKSSANGLRFKELHFNLAELNVVKNRKGELNVDSIQNTTDAKIDYKFGGVDKVLLSLRTIRFTDLLQPGNNYETDLGIDREEVTNIKSEEQLKAWAILLGTRIVLQEKYKAEGKPRHKLGAQTLLKLLRTQ